MKIEVKAITDNKEILDACRVTIWKDSLNKEPSEEFMKKIYKAEHSPIRDKWFVINITGIKSWLATHFVRHSVGYTPYVSTQRDDRIEYTGSRDDRKQGELVNMRITLNAQSIINVSRKRLCGQAHKEAQQLWNDIIKKLNLIDEHLATNCVEECVYRGFCPEINCCGRINSEYIKEKRLKYIDNLPSIKL